jgi:dihydroorotase
VAGGTTSFMEMPNVNPQTTTIDALEAKYQIAANSAAANYSFYLGATNDNLEEIKKLDPKQSCGIKIFMGPPPATCWWTTRRPWQPSSARAR